MHACADRDLVDRARLGDAAASGELFSRYWRAARGAAFGVTGEHASAEDAAAEGFQRALAGLDALRDADRFGPWLRTIVVRTARLVVRRRHPTVDAATIHLPDERERPDETVERLEELALMQRGMRELPERLREAMALSYFEGYAPDAAARFLDIPPGTLRRRLHDGRKQLRRAIEGVLHGGEGMNDERTRQVEQIQALIETGDIYQALRHSLALRPPAPELLDLVFRTHTAPANEALAAATGPENTTATRRQMADRLLRPSEQASDPNQPIGAIAAAIREALPEFQEWLPDAGAAAARVLSPSTSRLDLPKAVMPPGFAEGRPGSFLRVTRALMHPTHDGRMESVYQLL